MTTQAEKNPIIRAIDGVFSDTSVDPDYTLAQLYSARSHIDILIETLEDDIDSDDDIDDDDFPRDHDVYRE